MSWRIENKISTHTHNKRYSCPTALIGANQNSSSSLCVCVWNSICVSLIATQRFSTSTAFASSLVVVHLSSSYFCLLVVFVCVIISRSIWLKMSLLNFERNVKVRAWCLARKVKRNNNNKNKLFHPQLIVHARTQHTHTTLISACISSGARTQQATTTTAAATQREEAQAKPVKRTLTHRPSAVVAKQQQQQLKNKQINKRTQQTQTNKQTNRRMNKATERERTKSITPKRTNNEQQQQGKKTKVASMTIIIIIIERAHHDDDDEQWARASYRTTAAAHSNSQFVATTFGGRHLTRPTFDVMRRTQRVCVCVWHAH